MERRKIRVAISHGDINGIGYEVILKTFAEEAILDLFTPVVFGSLKAWKYWQQELNIFPPKQEIITKPQEITDGVLNFINCESDGQTVKVEIGQPTDLAGMLAFQALEQASQAVLRGWCQVLVTAPINKATMPRDLFPFNGHTKYLEAVAAQTKGQSLMLLSAGDCRVALATEHIPLTQVSSALSKELILDKIQLLEASLIRDFAITKPRIAVLGLNPHSGDNGLMGREEIEIITPAIKEASSAGKIVFGPYPADGYWTGNADAFDGVIAMYHDQGLAPFKAMYMDEGVNTTIGLTIVRTSPDHGTGYGIAGKGQASPNSFRSAIYQAIDIYRSRQRHDVATRNPLRKTFVNRSREDEKIDLSKEEDY